MMPNPECMEAGMTVYQYKDSTGMAVCGVVLNVCLTLIGILNGIRVSDGGDVASE